MLRARAPTKYETGHKDSNKAIWLAAVKMAVRRTKAVNAKSESTGRAVVARRTTPSRPRDRRICNGLLVLFGLLFYITDLLCDCLKGVFVVCVLRLQFYALSADVRATQMTPLPCCFLADICCC